jgi:hypothetical protein
MTQESFEDRANALENAFFAEVDARLLDKLRTSFEKDSSVEELAVLSGISDKAILQTLVDAGVTGRSVTALRIFPLVAVAWADNVIQSEEREAIMVAASKEGITRESPTGLVLESWLAKKPSDPVFEAWEGYAKALVSRLDKSEAAKLRSSIETDVKNVARSAGGVLGWAAESKGEKEVIKRVTGALQ